MEIKQLCPICQKELDTRNQFIWFCQNCAGYVNTVTGAAYNKDGIFVVNVISGITGANRHNLLVSKLG